MPLSGIGLFPSLLFFRGKDRQIVAVNKVGSSRFLQVCALVAAGNRSRLSTILVLVLTYSEDEDSDDSNYISLSFREIGNT